MLSFHTLMDSVPAHLETGTTTNTPIRKERKNRLVAYALGVVAPPAGKRASFEKNRGPNAGPVVKGKSLDLEDLPFCFSQPRGLALVRLHAPATVRDMISS
jgi:hypothetical protein